MESSHSSDKRIADAPRDSASALAPSLSSTPPALCEDHSSQKPSVLGKRQSLPAEEPPSGDPPFAPSWGPSNSSLFDDSPGFWDEVVRQTDKKFPPTPTPTPSTPSSSSSAAPPPPPPAVHSEIQTLKSELESKERALVDLQTKLDEARKEAAKAFQGLEREMKEKREFEATFSLLRTENDEKVEKAERDLKAARAERDSAKRHLEGVIKRAQNAEDSAKQAIRGWDRERKERKELERDLEVMGKENEREERYLREDRDHAKMERDRAHKKAKQAEKDKESMKAKFDEAEAKRLAENAALQAELGGAKRRVSMLEGSRSELEKLDRKELSVVSKTLKGTLDTIEKIQEEALNCIICSENPKAVIFDCGHAVCEACAPALIDCPMCRQPIARKQKIFL